MNLIWGLFGALLGLWLASDRYMLGAALAAAVAVLIYAQNDLGRRFAALEHELRDLRQRVAALARPPADPDARGAVEEIGHPPAAAPAPDVARPTAAAQPVLAAPIEHWSRPAKPKPADAPPSPSGPNDLERLASLLKRWLTEGNVPVKMGVLVLFAGVAAALRFAAAEGYLDMPIAARLALIAALALLALGWGWRERLRRPTFGLSVQGGAIGVLLLTVFAAFRLYALLPASQGFALVVLLVAGAAVLALLQRAMVLAVLGFLGGYLAPVLIATGSGNHVALFSYYAVLNAAVFAISWRQHWRLLNLIGFFFTFSVGSAWGASSYRPALFATVEPFLVLFFLFYVAIGLLYVVRQREHRRPWLDGSLVFGTPLVAFSLQAELLSGQPIALAWSALTVAAIYAGLVYWLRVRRLEPLLADAYTALGAGFVTLAVPLAFSAGTTASLWALEGAAATWLGLRQGKRLSWLAGLALQILAAGSYGLSELDHFRGNDPLLFNATWLGAAILGFSGVALALVHDRFRPQPPLPAVLMVWGLFWWSAAGLSQLDNADSAIGGWTFAAMYLSASVILASGLRVWLNWPRPTWALALAAGFGVALLVWANAAFPAPLGASTLPGWGVFTAAMLAALWSSREHSGSSVSLAHGLWLWTLVAAITLHIDATLFGPPGLRFMLISAPVALATFGLWRWPQWLAWPRAAVFESSYQALWFTPALMALGLVWVFGLFQSGAVAPWPYLPLFNPLELAVLAIGLLLWAYSRERLPELAGQRLLWLGMAFALLSMATLRAVHHGHGEPWSPAILGSGFAQTSLTVVWSLFGVTAWVLGSRMQRRPTWLAGAILMAVVLLKLVAVDRHHMGNVPGIVSFLAVGLLLVVVGYVAPSPPRRVEAE